MLLSPVRWWWTAAFTSRLGVPQVAFHVLQRYCHLLCRAGHFRTATEFTKLLFSLDLDQDPCACLLSLDFYAVRASRGRQCG